MEAPLATIQALGHAAQPLDTVAVAKTIAEQEIVIPELATRIMVVSLWMEAAGPTSPATRHVLAHSLGVVARLLGTVGRTPTIAAEETATQVPALCSFGCF
jgi:hypothetical protein